MKHQHKKSVRGFTVIELLIVIAIIVTATLVIINRVGAARQASAVKSESENLQALVATVQAAFAGRNDYTGLSNAYLLSMGGFPTQMIATGGAPINAWNGAVTVATGAPTTDATITYTNVPAKACVALVNTVAASFKVVSVAGTILRQASNPALQVNDLTATSNACGTTPQTVIVTF